MGNFKIEVDAAGGHGCQREIKDGGIVQGCGLPTCPDCLARNFVAELRARGFAPTSATFTHWPGEETEVVDDLVTHTRKGSF